MDLRSILFSRDRDTFFFHLQRPQAAGAGSGDPLRRPIPLFDVFNGLRGNLCRGSLSPSLPGSQLLSFGSGRLELAMKSPAPGNVKNE